jgi:hypothetical protein
MQWLSAARRTQKCSQESGHSDSEPLAPSRENSVAHPSAPSQPPQMKSGMRTGPWWAAAGGQSSISPQTAVNRREIPDTGPGAGVCQNRPFAGTLRPTPVPHVLLATQKVEGSNPFSRFEKGLHLHVLFVGTVGWSVCIAGHPLGTRRLTRGGGRFRTNPFAGTS